ncbi:MAG: hypothetical protein XXXJIFNMEKO3_00576 [Candidatus Erwinia impunctatus]|nr:hypothetical protein XXXJIFNMEKO_00576 [Culicoides impunctatus]
MPDQPGSTAQADVVNKGESMKASQPMNGNLLGILGGIIISTDSIFIRMMQIENSWTIIALRGFFMWGACLLVWLLWRSSRSVLGVPWINKSNLLPAVLFCLSSACFINALNRGNVATVLVIIASTPFISALILRIFFHTRVERSVMLAALAGMAGVVIVMSGKEVNDNMLANVFALATAVTMALAFIFTSKVAGGSVGLPSLGGLLASLVVLLFAGGEVWQEASHLTTEQYGWVITEGILIMPLAMGLIALSTRYVSAANAGLFLLLETALAPLWIALFLNEMPSPQAVTGGVIIIAAVVAQSLYARQRAKKTA